MKKKFIFIFLIILILLSSVSCQKKGDVKQDNYDRFAVATDIHILANSLLNEDNIDYYQTTDKMLHLSESIFDTMVNQLIEGKYKFLLLAGDLTERGDRVSHLCVTSKLKKLEDAGVEVYIINGNHDIMSNDARKDYSVTQAEFKELYRNYGYDEAASVLPGTLCYSADIQNKFRLIALDNIAYYADATQENMIPEVTDEKIQWVIHQAEDSKEKNLIPILLSHKGFMNHWPGIVSLISESVPEEYSYLPQSLLWNGVNLGFVGHNHLNDIMSYENSAGEKYYEVQTGSTLFCESNYRSVSYSDENIEINTVTLDHIDCSTISPYVSEDIVNAVKADFPTYSYKHFSQKINSTVQSNINKIFNKIDFGNETFKNFLKNDIIYAAFSMPLYKKDADGEKSLEQILEGYNVTLPQTDYKTFWDIVPKIVSNLVKGNEDLRTSSEIVISKYVAYSVFVLFNDKADEIALLSKDNNKINIDLDKLFAEGVLECYESNLVPAIASIALNSNIGIKWQVLFTSIKSNFNTITTFSDTIESLTKGNITSIGDYFGTYTVELEKLLEKGFFDQYAKDLLTDHAPDDRTLTINVRHEEN